MKRIIASLLICSLVLSGCVSKNSDIEVPSHPVTTIPAPNTQTEIQNNDVNFAELSDPDLLQYVEGAVYSNLLNEFNSDSYFVENVSAIYFSREYMEELAYNSQANIYFGYTLAELENQFQGAKFVFNLGEDGATIVQEFKAYDDTYTEVIRNVTVGTGVIMVCVTVLAVTAGAGSPAISTIFAASAKTGTAFALSTGVFSSLVAGLITGIETENLDQSIKSAALAGSESFKWSAISGALIGGVAKATLLKGATFNGLTRNEAAKIQSESKLNLEFIKNFHSMEEYRIYKNAGLQTTKINGQFSYTRAINLKYIDGNGRTNAQRIIDGFSPLDENGVAYELHHVGQKANSPLAILTKDEHISGGNDRILHPNTGTSEVSHGNAWQSQVGKFWEGYLRQTQGGL